MAQINVTNLTFGYEGSFDNIFEGVSFLVDTSWKLGFIGRNGKGKTTFLNLLLGKYEYRGSLLVCQNARISPQAIFLPALPEGWVVKSSGIEWRIMVLPIT